MALRIIKLDLREVLVFTFPTTPPELAGRYVGVE
jgi:hypothetical protein